MAPPGRTARRMTASARRDQLLDVTTELVVERGFHDVSIEQVARSAGITRAVVYQHFGDLQALLEAVIERETMRALAQVSETTLTDLTEGDPTELMLDSLRAYLHAVQDHPGTWRLILMPPEGALHQMFEMTAFTNQEPRRRSIWPARSFRSGDRDDLKRKPRPRSPVGDKPEARSAPNETSRRGCLSGNPEVWPRNGAVGSPPACVQPGGCH